MEAKLLLVLESGAGGYVASTAREKVSISVTGLGRRGWLFQYQSGGYASGRNRPRAGRIVELWPVALLGSPDENSMPGALQVAGARHGVVYTVVNQ